VGKLAAQVFRALFFGKEMHEVLLSLGEVKSFVWA
jgi:hypothetical protein